MTVKVDKPSIKIEMIYPFDQNITIWDCNYLSVYVG